MCERKPIREFTLTLRRDATYTHWCAGPFWVDVVGGDHRTRLQAHLSWQHWKRGHGFAGHWNLAWHMCFGRAYFHLTLASRRHWMKRVSVWNDHQYQSLSIRLGGIHLVWGWIRAR